MMVNKILVVEDDQNLRLTLVDNLELEGYQVFSASTLSVAYQVLQREEVDLIVLDIMLPDGSGYHFSKELRFENSNVMILMLTARTLNSDLIEGFSSGADDYMTKPYKLNELLARIKALLLRATPLNRGSTFVSQINGLEVNWQERIIINTVEGVDEEVYLTKKEFDLLHFLYSNLNKPLSREEILEKVWDKGVFVEERTVDNFISVIRKILSLNEPEEYFIKTVRGVGYLLSCKK